ncbi:MAG: hypothetical protein JO322_14650 [Candidatus Eremiobacteraeota bacterium]|nr:hypothetical protein [Candidatus Eremiobacteraeota bacterium]
MNRLFLRTAVIAQLAALTVSVSPMLAQAKGVVRVQQANGSTQTYEGVTFRVSGRKMFIQTNDKAGTLIINDAACSLRDNKILTCLPYAMSLQQGGQTRALDFQHGTIYYNKSDTKQTLSLSSTQLPPNGVLGSLRSSRGTYVNFSGTLDSRQ